MDPTVTERRRLELQGGTLRAVGAPNARALTIGAVARVVGRDSGCDSVLADSKVSAAHLELVATNRGVRVEDLGSKNGTFVDRHRIVEVYLTDEATLVCGDSKLAFTPAKLEPMPVSRQRAFGKLTGGSSRMRALFEQLRVLSRSNLSVLILGETGAGKELVAQTIHDESPRAGKPFVVIDCGAIPTALAESTLFGHERGAFTGAISKRASPFAEANGGTVFLDEIGELPLETQPKLLRVLAEQRVKSVGADTYTAIDVRVVAATRRDVLKDVNAETFRSDLYFRVAQAKIELPPLRERGDDVPLLIERILADLGAPEAYRRVIPESLDRAQRHDWPGNVRELRNVVSLALAYDDGGPIDLARHLGGSRGVTPAVGAAPTATATPFDGKTFADAKGELEHAYFLALHGACKGIVSEIARKADVDRKTVRESLKRYGIGK